MAAPYAASLATVFECLFERWPRHVRAALLAWRPVWPL